MLSQNVNAFSRKKDSPNLWITLWKNLEKTPIRPIKSALARDCPKNGQKIKPLFLLNKKLDADEHNLSMNQKFGKSTSIRIVVENSRAIQP